MVWRLAAMMQAEADLLAAPSGRSAPSYRTSLARWPMALPSLADHVSDMRRLAGVYCEWRHQRNTETNKPLLLNMMACGFSSRKCITLCREGNTT